MSLCGCGVRAPNLARRCVRSLRCARSASPGPVAPPTCLGSTTLRAQGPSIGFAPTLAFALVGEALRDPCHVRAKYLCTRSPCVSRIHRRHTAGPPCPATSPRSRFASRLPSKGPGRCPSPTSATDCFASSTHESLDSRARSRADRPSSPDSRRAARCGAGPPCGNPTPSGHTLDGVSRLRPILLASAPSASSRRMGLLGGSVAAAFSTASEVENRTSDAPCRACCGSPP